MTGRQNISSLLVALGLALPMVACGGGEESTPTPEPTEPPAATETPAPTPEPTEPPTAVPTIDQWQKMTYFAIAPEGQGVDVDGQGGADNGIYSALETIQEGILEPINAAIDAAVEAGEITAQQAQAAKTAAERIVEGALSVDTINTALARNIEDAEGFLAVHFEGTQPDSSITYWTADAQSTEVIVPAENLGTQAGTMDFSGENASEFGPGTFDFFTEITIPQQEPIVVGFEVTDARTRLSYDDTLVQNALTGGGVEILQLVNLVEVVVVAVAEALAEQGIEIDTQAILDQTETALLAASDITCPSTGNECFSVGFSYNSVETISTGE